MSKTQNKINKFIPVKKLIYWNFLCNRSRGRGERVKQKAERKKDKAERVKLKAEGEKQKAPDWPGLSL